MKETLKLENGKEIAVEITEEQVKELEKPKKTGYERVGYGNEYFTIDGDNFTRKQMDDVKYDDDIYDNANYYSDITVAENNARADRLYRQLRRFAVEHRKANINWNEQTQWKWYIYYDYAFRTVGNKLRVGDYCNLRDFGQIYFDSEEAAEAAIEEFKDELIWYFTEYKDSL